MATSLYPSRKSSTNDESAPSKIFEDTEDVFQHIQMRIQEAVFRGERQRFLPRLAFDEVTTKDVIRLVALEDEEFLVGEEALERFVEQVFNHGKKLFATCVQGSLPMLCLQHLLDSNLTDADMPLAEEKFPGNKMKRRFVGGFLPNQALFNTAYFDLDSIQDLNGLTKPISYDESNLIGRGAFGAVYNVRIPKEHRSFLSGNMKDEFAMKVTHQRGNRELPYHQAMAGLFHSHLVKCLASFTFNSQYHMIYEKADRNLEEFMQKHRNASELSFLTPQDLAQQVLGMIGAVSVIHNQFTDDDSNLLSVQKPSPKKSGYLHDIKPDNILVFKYDRPHQHHHFRLSDFSCAKVVAFVQSVSGKDRGSWQTTNRMSTPIYRAPEYTTEGKTSRPYDIWSLGCVILELLVWYTEGYEALSTFRQSRFRAVKPGGLSDEGFYYTEKLTSNAKAYLRKQVADQLEKTSSRCEGSLRIIAKVIPEMLQIDPKDRPTAEHLVRRLNVVGQSPQPPNIVFPTNGSDLPTIQTSLSRRPAYTSDSDSDIGPIVHVQRPTDE